MLLGLALHWQTFGLKYLTGTPKHIRAPFSPSLDLLFLAARTIPTIMWQPLELGLMVAKSLILKEWKSPTPPSFQVWVNNMLSIIQIVSITSQWTHFSFLGTHS